MFNKHDEGYILHQMFAEPAPAYKPCKVWISDNQGGGWIEYMTQQEMEAHEAELAKEAKELEYWKDQDKCEREWREREWNSREI